MKRFLTLVKLLFTQQFRATVSSGKKKKGGIVAVFVLLGVIFLPMLVGIAIAMYGLGGLMGANQGVVAFLILGCQALVLLLGISSLIVGVFMPRDADKLLYLPLKPSQIFLAKLTVAYLNEVLTTAGTILFLLLPYGLGAGLGVGYYLMLLLGLFLIPLLPILLGTIIAMPISLLLSKVGKNGIGKTVMTTVFFLAFMALYMWGLSALTQWESNLPDGEITIDQVVLLMQGIMEGIAFKMVYLHTDYVLAGAMIANSFGDWVLNFLLTVAEFAILGGLTLLIARPFYKFMLANQVEGGGGGCRGAKVKYETKSTSVVKQLVITDFKRTIRDSQMGFQAFAGLIMMPLIVIIFAFAFSQGEIDEGLDFVAFAQTLEYQLIAPTVLTAYLTLLGSGTNVLGLYPITRENKSFYILKSLPVDGKRILFAKVVLATVVMFLVDLIVAVVAVFALRIGWYYGIAMLLVLALSGFGSMCITTKMDLKEPKFGWTNFNQSLKNAKNSWIAMLVGFLNMAVLGLVATAFIILYFFTEGVWAIPLMWVALIGVSFLYAYVAYKNMAGSATKLFDRIEA